MRPDSTSPGAKGRPSKTTIVTPQIPIAYQNGGIGTFVGHFTRLLKDAGHDLTIIYTDWPQRPAEEWLPYYEQNHIKLVNFVSEAHPLRPLPHYPYNVMISELAHKAIPEDTDVVYFAEFRANGLLTIRNRRFSTGKLPVTVTVMHGSSEWHREGQQIWPSSYEELVNDYSERYVVQHSDFVVSPSHYGVTWAEQKYWQLPPQERVRVLGYPFFPDPRLVTARSAQSAGKFKRIVFFGRMETRKGLDIFVKALRLVKSPLLKQVDEVVLLGNEGVNIYGSSEVASTILKDQLGKRVKILNRLDSYDAQVYLAQNAPDTLAVIPSRSETMGFTIIEASLIPGLNMICSNVGGIPEVLGPGARGQLFDPTPSALARKLDEWLQSGPKPSDQLGHYDWESANRLWLAFHDEVYAYAQKVRSEPPRIFAASKPAEKAVDVCITHYNLGKYLPYLLDSLAKQTTDDFNVFVLDDGSTDPDSQAAFESAKQKYQNRGWHFERQANQGVCVARNYVASLGKAEYLFFVDSDNVAAPNMIERFLDCIRASQDDCLTCYMYAFEGEGSPRWANTLLPPPLVYIPYGNCLEAGLIENPFGDLNGIMRRSAFNEIGGFTLDYPKYINQEDRELFTRMALKGYKFDVVPEFLFYYRLRDDSRLRTTEVYQNEGRVLRAYEEELRQVHLERLAPLLLGLRYRSLETQAQISTLSDEVDYLVNRVRWRTLVKAFRGKIQKNLRKMFRGVK